MSNLSDLLPAGASAKQITATDSGSGIASKAPVVLNSDGTVTGISETTDSAAVADLQTVDAYSGISAYSRVCYAPTQDRLVLIYCDRDNSDYPTYRVGTMSSGAITWTTPTVIDSTGSGSFVDIIYHANTGKLVLTYAMGSEQKITIGEFGSSPYTTITWGSPSNALSSAAWFYATVAEWQGTDKFVLQATELGGGYQGNARVGTISGSTFSMGTQITWTSAGIANLPSHQDMVYDTNIGDQMLLAYCIHDSSATNFATQVLTLSGTDVTSTTPQAVSTTTAGSDIIGLAWDTDLKQALLIYGEEPEDSYGIATSFVVVISTSSGSSTVNTAINFASVAGNQFAGLYRKGVVYDSSKKRFALTYLPSTLAQQMTEITVSGTTPSFSGTNIAVGAEAYSETVGSALDTNSGKMVVVCADKDNSNYISSWVYTISGTSTNLTAQAFVGIADSAISASAAGSIIVQGGTVTGMDLGTGFITGTPEPFESATVTTIANAYDSNSNKTVIAYDDGGDSNQGKAVVATVSGTTITYGTPEPFDSGNSAESIAATFDSNSNKIVIVYRQGNFPSGTYGYGYAVVGTVSGTSITFGTRVAFNSAATTNIGPDGIAFDPDTNQVVIAYRDDGNSDYGTAIVGSVSTSPDTLTFGAEEIIETGQTSYHSVIYDTNTDRIVIAYRHDAGSGYGKAKVGEISGTSITLGASTDFLGASTSQITGTFDSSQNKVVIAYSGTSTYGTARVGEVTGGGTNTIAFAGSEEVFNSASTGPIANAVFDTDANKTIVAYCNSVSPFYGYAVRGTVSGTAITFSTSSLIVSTQVSGAQSASFDSSSNNVVYAYRDVDSSNYGTALVADYGVIPLITGTKYFVTPTGGFSSSAGDPSVNAGLAISTTSLLLNGDS